MIAGPGSPSGGRVAPRAPGVLSAAVCLLLVPVASLLDRAASAPFYRTGEGFFLAHWGPMDGVYRGAQWMIGTVAVLLLLALLGGSVPGARRLREARPWLAFAAAALALGPGLITNSLLKDHWGRPRPYQVTEFGGTARYVPPWRPSDACSHNCSFPSGHAVSGFYFITGAWLWPRHRRRWLLTGLLLGGGIGAVRVIQGGHFLSDVLGSLAVVWTTNVGLALTVQRFRLRFRRNTRNAPIPPQAE